MPVPDFGRGDLILSGGGYMPVVDRINYAPGEHPESPIRNDQHATEYRTARGSRWFGESYRGTENAENSARIAEMDRSQRNAPMRWHHPEETERRTDVDPAQLFRMRSQTPDEGPGMLISELFDIPPRERVQRVFNDRRRGDRRE